MSRSCTIVADVLLDGESAEPVTTPVVEVVDGVIRAVGTSHRSVPRSGRVLDYRGCSLAPGLIDSHAHLALRPDLPAPDAIAFVQHGATADVVATMRTSARAALASGITMIRDCGSPGRTAMLLRDEPDPAGHLPRLIVSGRPVTTQRGHCHWMGLIAGSAAELRSAVRDLHRDGADFVKVMATGGMMTPGSDPYAAQYSAEALGQLVTEAHARGMRVAAHALSAEGILAAVEAGVDTIEHFATITSARQDYDLSLAAAIQAAGIVVGVTAHHSLRELLISDDLQQIRARLAPHRALREAGVRMVVHSDAGTPGTRFEDFAQSVEIFMHGMQVPVPAAIAAATGDAATALGIDQNTGTVRPGKQADLIIVDGPLDRDIRSLRRPVAVIKGGRQIAARIQ